MWNIHLNIKKIAELDLRARVMNGMPLTTLDIIPIISFLFVLHKQGPIPTIFFIIIVHVIIGANISR